MSFEFPVSGWPVTLQTGVTYDVLKSDKTILCEVPALGLMGVTLPELATTDLGLNFFIKNTGTGIATVSGTPPNRIDFAPSKTLGTQFDSIHVVAGEDADANLGWYIVASYQNGSP